MFALPSDTIIISNILQCFSWVYLWIVIITPWSKPSGCLHVFLWFNGNCFSIMVWIVICRILNCGLAYQVCLRNKPANLRVVLAASLAIWIFTTRYIYQRPLTVNIQLYQHYSTLKTFYFTKCQWGSHILAWKCYKSYLSGRVDFWTSGQLPTLAVLWKRCIFQWGWLQHIDGT